MNNLAYYLARLYYAAAHQSITSVPLGFTEEFWAERLYRLIAGFPDKMAGGKNTSFWLELLFYKKTNQTHRLATGTYPAWFWLSKLYAFYAGQNTSAILQPASAAFWAEKLVTLPTFETPKISVSVNGVAQADGGSYASGDYNEAATAEITCTVENIGTALLTIQNPTVDGHIVSASAFSDLTLVPAQSVTSTITLNTATSILTVARTGNIHIASDDPDTPSFDVQINFNANPVWLLNDNFITAAGAPLASPRTCEPMGTLTLTQTDGQFSISSGKLNFPGQATPIWGDEGLVDPTARARSAGLALIASFRLSSLVSGQLFGWADAANIGLGTLNTRQALNFASSLGGLCFWNGSTNLVLDSAPATSTDYQVAFIARAAGVYALLKIGTDSWRVVWVGTFATFANMHAIMSNFNNTGTLDNFRVRQLHNDWQNTNPIATSVLAGARSAGDTFTHTADAIIDWIATTLPSAGGITVDFRKQDASNLWRIRIESDGTIRLREVVAGVSMDRASFNSVVVSGHRIVGKCDGTTIRVYSGAAGSEALRITYASATNFQTATAGVLSSLGAGGAAADIIANPITISGNPVLELDKGL